MERGIDTATGAAAMHRDVVEESADLHVITTLDGLYLFASTAGAARYGWSPADLVGKHQRAFTHRNDVALVEQARQQAVADGGSTGVTRHRFRCRDGTHRWTEALSRAVGSGPDARIVTTIRDIGERREAERTLRRRASTDQLTGVANRAVLVDRLEQALLRLQRHGGQVGVLFCDLDGFKQVNDVMGHVTGDAVLRQVVTRLRHVLRPQDTLARWGGDEFAIVVEDLQRPEDAVDLAARVLEVGRTQFSIAGTSVMCTLSVGISVTADPTATAAQLIDEADLAAYRAKATGRDRYDIFDEGLRENAGVRAEVERMLRDALAEDRLRLAYQPIVDLESGTTGCAEVLVRVFDPGRIDLVPASSFIDVARQTGLLSTIDGWVLSRAIQQATTWTGHDDGARVGVTVNVGARQLATVGFGASVLRELATHGLPPAVLGIEFTEGVIVEVPDRSRRDLLDLRAAGVQLGLDDFGVDSSSLAGLRSLPLDYVKLHPSLVHQVGRGRAGRSVVAAVIDLAHALDLVVVAEGVEDAWQLGGLQALGCDQAQGVHIAPVGSADELCDRLGVPVPVAGVPVT